MKNYLKIYITLLLLTVVALQPENADARNILTAQAERDYTDRLINQPGLKDILTIPSDITQDESDALKFLYAYLATPDILDYDKDFYLRNIRVTLKASEEMPWGSRVPDREWRHFVLPIRVNNENLDMSREVFYNELKERVKGLSMEEAVLEVNHWCHEKVSYQPSDARTSSPLATVCNALGRCGEESTFTVAALRSIGIPARQVYTPRWAHTDDNHAWVEAWTDGKWHFLGACEPEPVLDLGWFNAPASRGMLMSTNVIGHYGGPEEQLLRTPLSTVINVTENYAPVRSSSVIVTDTADNPVKDAVVRFSLYNYAEFYPLVTKRTDVNGFASFTSGCGDMLIWASDGKKFNFVSISAGDTVRIPLNKDENFEGVLELDLVPPSPGVNILELSAEEIEENNSRKSREDEIRMSYVNTFHSPETAKSFCDKLNLPETAADLLLKSRGNHLVVEEFLRNTPECNRERAVSLLSSLTVKDLHDVTIDVLEDNMKYTTGNDSSPLFVPYVLNPRIELEMLRPFKRMVNNRFSKDTIDSFRANPILIKEYISSGSASAPEYNPVELRQSVTSVIDYGVSDPLNQSLAFVAICRSLGIPARIDPVSHTVQYADVQDCWHDVSFTYQHDVSFTYQKDLATDVIQKSVLKIENVSEDYGQTPKYYSHFTLSGILDGVPELMEFDDFESHDSINARNHQLLPGQYLLVTGQRLADGTVLSRANIFKVRSGETASPLLVMRNDSTALKVIGNLNAELHYLPVTFTKEGPHIEDSRSILSTTGRGYYILGLIQPGHEPSAHAINDIAMAAEELAATGRKLLILLPDAESLPYFRIEEYGKLPKNVVFGIDSGSITNGVKDGLELEEVYNKDFPLFVIADSFNRIVYAQRGYTINLGQTLAGLLRTLE